METARDTNHNDASASRSALVVQPLSAVRIETGGPIPPGASDITFVKNCFPTEGHPKVAQSSYVPHSMQPIISEETLSDVGGGERPRTLRQFFCAEYQCWIKIRARCYDAQQTSYPNYGGRGIRVCDRWLDFVAFLSDMGPRPSPVFSIDRIDNDGDYTPENCRWATRAQQQHNTRQVRILSLGRESMCLKEWARKIGITPAALRGRLRRHPVEVALACPPRKRAQRNTQEDS